MSVEIQARYDESVSEGTLWSWSSISREGESPCCLRKVIGLVPLEGDVEDLYVFEEMTPMKLCYRSCLIIAPAASKFLRCILLGLPLLSLILTSFAGNISAAPFERSAPWSLRQFELLDQFSGATESNESNAYLKAVADSLEITNTFLASNGKKRLFCSETTLDVSMLRALIRNRISFLSELGREAEAAKAHSGVVVAILQALRERFPCR